MMTAAKYVRHIAKLIGADVISAGREVLVYDWSTGKGLCIVEASGWDEARAKLSAYMVARQDARA